MEDLLDVTKVLPFAAITDSELQHVVLQCPLPLRSTLPILSSVSLDFSADPLHCSTAPPVPQTWDTNHFCCSYSTTDEISRWPSLANLFSVININMRSLKANFRKLALLLTNFDHQPDIIVLTETWLKPATPLSPFHIKIITSFLHPALHPKEVAE